MKFNRKVIYLDANFLVYWWVCKKPELKKRAQILFAQLRANQFILALSPLTFDESWNAIRKELNVKLSCYDPRVFEQIQNLTSFILSTSFFQMVQFKNLHSGIKEALNNIKQFQLRPRDAFHLAIMKDNNIHKMVTNDPKFISQQSKMEIRVIWV